MREILFRGKRLDNGEWVFGWYQPPARGIGVTLAIFVENDHLNDVRVVPETVGQYVGVNDIHGNKVFEHDLVVFMWGDQKVIMRIVFSDGEFLMRPVKKYDFETWPIRVSGEKMEVVGNAFDNPEMMEE